MSGWRCRECGGTLYTERDDELMVVALAHPCVNENPVWLQEAVEWIQKRLGVSPAARADGTENQPR